MKDSVKEKVKLLFEDYIKDNGHRKTPERFEILDVIYSSAEHFDIESIHRTLVDERKFRVSMGTIYNTLDLLVEAKLIFKYQFGDGSTHYERAYNRDNHYHRICTECGSVKDFASEAVDTAFRDMELPHFTMKSHSISVYGVCSACARKTAGKNKE